MEPKESIEPIEPKESIEPKEPKIPFWSENPNVLFDPKYILEFFPVESMSYQQKLNAISRIVLLLTILGFVFSQNFRLIVVAFITLGAIFLIHYYHKKTETNENFVNPAIDYLDDLHILHPSTLFDTSSPSNPFSNVLMTDYDYNVDKKPAPPAFNKNVNEDILANAKQMVVDSNPGQPDIADKLFKDLGEQMDFEHSLRQFTSNSSTTIPNDQGAFAEFCYGSMISCKEGNRFACARNLSRHTSL
jgi:hypothetical protein